ncbi:ATP synthase I [Sphingobium quisquiliarum P25]|uniref:ATP synthase I n=1 Tax=Sphingobium quisquiliarum P25 TaxID=1329909 RepID=T0HKT3_9SPHN|nr:MULTISPECIES: AtpZ/AtpI family protein [Sphingobium]EQA98198.1 ATP synthase I [Sphingobium quisquiliarum P25]EZP71327.1 ATP synthase I [Sphingomonas paucimobilis]
MVAEVPGQDPADEDARIASLEERIGRAERAEQVRQGTSGQKADDGSRLGNRVLAELIGGLAGGAVVGGTLDYFLRTSPWLLLAFLGLGIVVAFRNIIRLTTAKRPDQ